MSSVPGHSLWGIFVAKRGEEREFASTTFDQTVRIIWPVLHSSTQSEYKFNQYTTLFIRYNQQRVQNIFSSWIQNHIENVNYIAMKVMNEILSYIRYISYIILYSEWRWLLYP